MFRTFGAICLVSGTAIGAGIIALPITLASIGMFKSIFLMALIWLIMLMAALINTELNLRAGEGLPLGLLGRKFSGRIAEVIGNTSMGLLSYAVLSAYFYGGTSTFQSILEYAFDAKFSFLSVALVWGLCLSTILMCSISKVDFLNRLLFIGLISMILMMITFMLGTVSPNSIIEPNSFATSQTQTWFKIIPVIFTSFGFQIICHTLADFCKNDKAMLQKAFFWGSLIPLIIYISWSIAIMSVLSYGAPEFYKKIMTEGTEVGELILVLMSVTKVGFLKQLVWLISALAIITSAIGVSLGLSDIWKKQFSSRNYNFLAIRHDILTVVLTILPPFIIAILLPNAFIKALGFAGMIMSVQAIFLPIYLLIKSNTKNQKFHYQFLKYPAVILFIFTFGVLVLVSEINNIFF